MEPTTTAQSIRTILDTYYVPKDRIESIRVTTNQDGEPILVVNVNRAYVYAGTTQDIYDVTGAE